MIPDDGKMMSTNNCLSWWSPLLCVCHGSISADAIGWNNPLEQSDKKSAKIIRANSERKTLRNLQELYLKAFLWKNG
jgi:hypothetical protein